MAGAQDKQVRRVLILYEVGPSSPAVALLEQGILAALEDSPFKIELYREYLETTLFSDPASQQEFREWYIRKYRKCRPDLILSAGPSSLRFVVSSHEAFFHDVPVVFFASTEEAAGHPKLNANFTGVWEVMEPAKTVEAALRLQPGTQHVVVVGGTSTYDRSFEAWVREQLRKYESKLDVNYLTDLTMQQMLDRLHHLPNHTVVLLTSIARDAAGQPFLTSIESGPMVVQSANAPVFSLTDDSLGHGEVGGDVSSYAAAGKVAGGIVERILNGERPQDIPVVRGTNTYLFDWRALRRWGLKESDLPPGSVVLNRQMTFWEAYRRYILAGLFLLLAQTLAISALLWQRAIRRKTQLELLTSNQRLRLAMESGQSVGWEWDFAGGRGNWFGDLQTVFGIPADTFASQVGDFYRYVHPEDREQLSRTVDDAKLKCEPFSAEFRVVRPDGSTRWVVSRGEFDYNGDSQPRRMRGMAVDVTERKEVQERLEASQNRLESIVESAMDAVMAVDDEGRIVVFNPAAEKMFGCPSRYAIGTSVDRLIPERFRASHGAHLRQLSETGTNDRAAGALGALWGLRTTGEEFPIEASFSRTEDGGKKLFTVIIRDITERRRAEEALSRVSRRLIEAQEEERTRIARELHDDISQRVALLAISLDELKRGLPSSEAETNRRMEEACEQAVNIGSDIRALSHRLHSSKLDYLGLVAACAGFCRELSERQGGKVDFHSEGIPRNLPKDMSLCLFRVLQEALQNAVKHSGVRHFKVSLHGGLNEIRLSVHDSGAGFEPDKAISGPGLGLTSMKERLRLVEGDLSIDSKPMGGTTIRARVPLTPRIKPAV